MSEIKNDQFTPESTYHAKKKLVASTQELVFVLNISKLNDVIEVLRQYNFPEKDWFMLGLTLGLLHPTLTAIEATHGNDVGRALMECLTKWLTNADNNITSVGPLTWQTLVSALKKIKENTIAEAIQKTLINPASQLLQLYEDKIALVTFSDDMLSILSTEDIISKNTEVAIRNCNGALVGSSLRATCAKVADDHNKLRIFAHILLKSGATALAKELLCDCDKILSYQKDEPIKKSDQQTITQKSASKEVYINESDKLSFDRMRIQFGSFLNEIIPLLTKKIQSWEKLKSFLERCYPELKPELVIATTVETILQIVEEECTIINIVMLEAIASYYKITEAQEIISKYNHIVDSFCYEIKLKFMLEKKLSSNILLTSERIEFVLDWNPDQYVLNDIKRLLVKAFNELSKRVIVRSIHEGHSIMIICYAPQYLKDSLLLEVQMNVTVLIEEFFLIQLTIGHYKVYERSNIKSKQTTISTPKDKELQETHIYSTPPLQSETDMITEYCDDELYEDMLDLAPNIKGSTLIKSDSLYQTHDSTQVKSVLQLLEVTLMGQAKVTKTSSELLKKLCKPHENKLFKNLKNITLKLEEIVTDLNKVKELMISDVEPSSTKTEFDVYGSTYSDITDTSTSDTDDVYSNCFDEYTLIENMIPTQQQETTVESAEPLLTRTESQSTSYKRSSFYKPLPPTPPLISPSHSPIPLLPPQGQPPVTCSSHNNLPPSLKHISWPTGRRIPILPPGTKVKKNAPSSLPQKESYSHLKRQQTEAVNSSRDIKSHEYDYPIFDDSNTTGSDSGITTGDWPIPQTRKKDKPYQRLQVDGLHKDSEETIYSEPV